MAWHLAQVNIGRLRATVDDPLIADFVAGLDRINAMADGAPGFVWRLQTEDGNATAIRPPEAFTFKCRFAPPDDGSIVAADERDVCRA